MRKHTETITFRTCFPTKAHAENLNPTGPRAVRRTGRNFREGGYRRHTSEPFEPAQLADVTFAGETLTVVRPLDSTAHWRLLWTKSDVRES